MDRPNTVSGLREKHSEIAGQIEHTRAVLARLVADLEAVEHTIRLFDPDAELPRAKPVPSPHAAFKGEMRRDVMAALRTCGEPATSLWLARKILAGRGLPDDAKTVTLFRKRVGAALYKLRAKGWVEEVPQAGEYKGWVLTT
ncbi:hypothetical protein LRS10_08795 [Phenylobacterium sp. J426]|uniref:hypothetical protein n=1 Tax=Phenylobacterium sp. J426 TaxID=2898439 RepID=UPI00215128E1|nr:hypothetical protein [Phenylobacterium sp. J426]MCR5873968.1 hypothetical protein [Phenylobacterium sp. J426]MCR5874253.1 hypothetical protein [Phenylobacterium sp. J426]